MKDNRRRITSLGNEVNTSMPNGDINEITNLTNEEGIQQTISDFKDRIKGLISDETILKGTPEIKNITKERKWLEEK